MVSQIKARMAATAADQELHKHLANAKRELLRALDTCVRVGRSRDINDPLVGTMTRRAKDYKQVLDRVLREVDGIGYLASATQVENVRQAQDQARRREKAQAQKAAEGRRKRGSNLAQWGGEDEGAPTPFSFDSEDDVVDLGEGGFGDSDLDDEGE